MDTTFGKKVLAGLALIAVAVAIVVVEEDPQTAKLEWRVK